MRKDFVDFSLCSPWYHQKIQKPTQKACDLRSLTCNQEPVSEHCHHIWQNLSCLCTVLNDIYAKCSHWCFISQLSRIDIVLRPCVCTCRQSARRCSSLWGRARRGDSAPSDSSRICGPWHSTWRHVSLCTLRLLGFPSLLNRKDLYDAGNKKGINSKIGESLRSSEGKWKKKDQQDEGLTRWRKISTDWIHSVV